MFFFSKVLELADTVSLYVHSLVILYSSKVHVYRIIFKLPA